MTGNQGRLNDRVALVVGGGADGPVTPNEPLPMGNGRAIAVRLAAEGARVAVTDINEQSAQATVAMFAGAGLAIQADAADPDQCVAAVRRTEEFFGRVDIVVCNVGVIGGQRAKVQSVDNWDRTLNINVRSHWLTAQAALPGMMDRGRGVFLFVTSTEALASGAISLAYEASKSAQLGVMRHFAVGYGARGIRSNALALGIINSSMVKRTWGEGLQRSIAGAVSPLGRPGTPEESAAAAAFLVSDDASYVNGACLVVDGGLTVANVYPSP